jgi:hypothetical protein
MEFPTMKMRFPLGSLLLPLFLVTGIAGSAGTAAPAAATDSPRILTITVVESLGRHPGRIDDFTRIDLAFTEVFEQRKWPVKIKVERFAGNTPTPDTELRIYYQGIREEGFGDQTFRAWMTLNDHGTKTDFGIIRYQYYPRALEHFDDMQLTILRGAAEVAATKVESVLFPKTAAPKP